MNPTNARLLSVLPSVVALGLAGRGGGDDATASREYSLRGHRRREP